MGGITLALLILTACETAPTDPVDPTSELAGPSPTAGRAGTSALVTAEVIAIVDGDTIRVLVDGREEPVRLIGVNAPETGGPYRDRECYGKEAADLVREFVPIGSTVQLERDQTDRDRYDRLLRYVWLPRAGGEPVLLNEVLVAGGAARARSYPPDTTYQTILRDAEATAISREAGQWDQCTRGRGG
ncbi:MAG TPA: thermonuclease family protein [Thermomicrobiales bacterium]|nr:thermonuclease family protein [Thermomicrobiales bacterium]